MAGPDDAPTAPPLSSGKVRLTRRLADQWSRHLLGRFSADWIWPRRWQFIGAFVFTAGLALATGAYPLIIQASFNAFKDGSTAKLPWVIGAILVVTSLRSVMLYMQTVSISRILMRLTTDMQTRAFAHLINADYARIARETSGHLVSRLLNDVGYISGAVQGVFNTIFRDTLQIIALVASMIYLDPIMTLVVLVVYPIAALPVALISERLRRVAKQTQAGLGDMTSLLTENLGGARLIKTFRLESYAAGRVNQSFEDILKLRMKSVRARARIDPLLEVLGGIAVSGVIALATWRISSGITSIGDFMGFVSALLMAAQPIRALGNLSAKVMEGLASIERVYEVFDEQPRVVDRPGAEPLAIRQGHITFKDVAFRYEGGAVLPAVQSFSLDVPGGRTIALVGRSGSGKSTIINLVPRLYDVTGGRIDIDGQDIRDVTIASLRDAISIVSQDVTLFDDTIAANIALGRLGASEADVIAAARAAAAHDFIMAQPDGYRTMIGDHGSRLSGGQRQRLALARAILKDAPILLLDEATSALDTESERLVQDALTGFTRNRTTLVVAHRLSTVQTADLICVMEDGLILELGTHRALMARDGAYARLCRAQMMAGAGLATDAASPALADDPRRVEPNVG